MQYRLTSLLGIIFLFLTTLVNAHGDLHERIKQVSSQIAESPDDFDLYQQRGDLYLQHEQYRKAWRDLRICEKKGVRSERLYYSLARATFFLNKKKESLAYIGQCLSLDPNHLRSIQLLARLHESKRDFAEAAHFFEQVISSSIRPIPQNYVDAALAWKQGGQLEDAIEILETGLCKMGAVPIFQKYLVEFYMALDRTSDALAIITNQVQESQRKEHPLVNRAEVYIQLGDHRAAEQDLRQAQRAIQDLPTHIKENQATQLLENRIEKLKSNSSIK